MQMSNSLSDTNNLHIATQMQVKNHSWKIMYLIIFISSSLSIIQNYKNRPNFELDSIRLILRKFQEIWSSRCGGEDFLKQIQYKKSNYEIINYGHNYTIFNQHIYIPTNNIYFNFQII